MVVTQQCCGDKQFCCCPADQISSPLAAPPSRQQESTAGQRQQQGGDWFNEAAAATGAVAGTPFETAFKSLQTAADILSWIAVEAEVRAWGWLNIFWGFGVAVGWHMCCWPLECFG